MSQQRPAPRISVVVPVYNVAGFLADCLDSVLTQSVGDLELVAVDDGSTDAGPRILEEYAARDPRVRVVRQDNAGLGAARNTGVDHARGDFLWFVDSDDMLAPGALDSLLAPLSRTGSDFATGNVWRLTSTGTAPARFLAPTFRRTRLRTHIRRFPPLLADRTAWNKLFRREFWDRHGFRFPTGVHYEDQYVTLPAHYLARSVDVVQRHVYLWRTRDEGELSITQQRAETRSMLDRIRAVAFVSDFLATQGWRRERRRYDESAVTHDLRYFLEAFADADDDYRSAFLDAVNSYLDDVDPRVFDGLPAVRRVAWQLARRRATDDLVDLLRRERSGPGGITAVRAGRRWYVELPLRQRADLAIPEQTFRVGRELRLVSEITELAARAGAIRVRGRARVDLLPGARLRRLRLVAVPLGRARPMVLSTVADVEGRFEATLPVAGVGHRRRRWWVVLVGQVDGLRRVAVYHDVVPGVARHMSVLDGAGGEVRLTVAGRGELRLAAGAQAPVLRWLRVDGAVLELAGSAGDVTGPAVRLVATSDGRVVEVPAHVEVGAGGATFRARLPLPCLASPGGATWRLALDGGAGYELAWAGPAREPVPGVFVGPGPDGYAQMSVPAG